MSHFLFFLNVIRRERRGNLIEGFEKRAERVCGCHWRLFDRLRCALIFRQLFNSPIFYPSETGQPLWKDHSSATFTELANHVFGADTWHPPIKASFASTFVYLVRKRTLPKLSVILELIGISAFLFKHRNDFAVNEFARICDYCFGQVLQRWLFFHIRPSVVMLHIDLSTKNLAIGYAANKHNIPIWYGQFSGNHFRVPPYNVDVILFRSEDPFIAYSNRVKYFDARKERRPVRIPPRAPQKIGVVLSAKNDFEKLFSALQDIEKAFSGAKLLLRVHPSDMRCDNLPFQVPTRFIIDDCRSIENISNSDIILASRTSLARELLDIGCPVMEIGALNFSGKIRGRLSLAGEIPSFELVDHVNLDEVIRFYQNYVTPPDFVSKYAGFRFLNLYDLRMEARKLSFYRQD